MSSWSTPVGNFPWPPQNATAMSAYHSSDTDIRWDDPSTINTGPQTATKQASVSIQVLSNPNPFIRATGNFEVVSVPQENDTIEVGGVFLTAVIVQPWKPLQDNQFDISSGNINTIASNIVNVINNGTISVLETAYAQSNGSTVNLYAYTDGEQGNLVTIGSSTLSIQVSSNTLLGGVDGDYVLLGNLKLSARLDRTSGQNDFSVQGNVLDIAQSLIAAINDSINYFGLFMASSIITNNDTLTIYVKEYMGYDGVNSNGISITTNSSSLVLSSTQTLGGVGVKCQNNGKSNSMWNIIGVNIYRSDTSEYGPYFRVNKVPVSSLFYRDYTNIVQVQDEIVDWNIGWVFKGDGGNAPSWRLKTKYTPMVKELGNAIPADSPFDITVKINGIEVPVWGVFGPTGEVDLNLQPEWDPSTETMIEPVIPTEQDVVTISYSYLKTQKLMNTLDRRFKVFYRLTTVAIDPTGQSPSGLVETPLEYSEPISPMNSEKMDYIWAEAIRRNRWILEQGGERVKLFIRRANGNPCDCVWDARLQEYSKQPLNMCVRCYGTGWVGGYEGPIDIIISPDDAERAVTQTANGRVLEHSYETWIGPTPTVSQRDFIVKQNGERFSIGPVSRVQVRGLVLQQSFNIKYLDTTDIRYRVPMSPLERLPWPQTRVTRPEDVPCEDNAPYPVGYDYQASPMMSDHPDIPEGRQQRGRTPVWQNITYGGKK